MNLTTNDLSWITDTSAKEWRVRCRTGTVFAWRENVNFAQWQIPVESFALYLHYHPLEARAFNLLFQDEQKTPVYTRKKELGDKMKKIKEELDLLDHRGPNEELISVNKLESIFGKDIYIWLCHRRYLNFANQVLRTDKPIPIQAVVRYLIQNPTQYEELLAQHNRIIRENPNDPKEPLIRHILMTYTYYTANGYFF